MKREREPACPVCGHYHKWELGEICNICGHQAMVESVKATQNTALPSEIIPDFLYLGSYDNASRNELLKAVGIAYILNTVPGCQNLYRNSFTYFNVTEKGKNAQIEECIQFLEEVRLKGGKILVHCMSGVCRSPFVIIAYLMKCRHWPFAQAEKWVVDRRPCVALASDTRELLFEFERIIFRGGIGEAPSVCPGSINSANQVALQPTTPLLSSFGLLPEQLSFPTPIFQNCSINSHDPNELSKSVTFMYRSGEPFMFGASELDLRTDTNKN
mmetsp:Transcript_15621/g.21592  ORF Transcript_15621/g.21592 Transcript_15621/m.21592 type:complete len:271 (-) Transcript_15621:152-964(-)